MNQTLAPCIFFLSSHPYPVRRLRFNTSRHSSNQNTAHHNWKIKNQTKKRLPRSILYQIQKPRLPYNLSQRRKKQGNFHPFKLKLTFTRSNSVRRRPHLTQNQQITSKIPEHTNTFTVNHRKPLAFVWTVVGHSYQLFSPKANIYTKSCTVRVVQSKLGTTI